MLENKLWSQLVVGNGEQIRVKSTFFHVTIEPSIQSALLLLLRQTNLIRSYQVIITTATRWHKLNYGLFSQAWILDLYCRFSCEDRLYFKVSWLFSCDSILFSFFPLSCARVWCWMLMKTQTNTQPSAAAAQFAASTGALIVGHTAKSLQMFSKAVQIKVVGSCSQLGTGERCLIWRNEIPFHHSSLLWTIPYETYESLPIYNVAVFSFQDSTIC